MSAAELRQATERLRERKIGRPLAEWPDIALPLADWLDIIASKEEAREDIDSPIPMLYLPEALTIARAINGGAS